MPNLPSKTSESLPSSQARARLEAWRASPERAAHREWIGGRIVTLLSHYWRDDDPTALTQALARDWADALESLPRSAIDMACKDYLRTQTRKPTPAAIAITASALVRHSLPPREPEPGREPRVTPERAAEIMREVYGTDQP